MFQKLHIVFVFHFRFTSNLTRALDGASNLAMHVLNKRVTETESAELNDVECNDSTVTLRAAATLVSNPTTTNCIPTVQNPNDSYRTTHAPTAAHRLCTSLQELKSAVNECNTDLGPFLHAKNNKLLTFIQVSDHRNTSLQMCVVVDDVLSFSIYVFGHEVPRDHLVFQELPVTVSSAHCVSMLLKSVSTFELCDAVNLGDISGILSVNSIGKSIAENNNRLRSTDCRLLVQHGNLCDPCKTLRRVVRMKRLRHIRHSGNDTRCTRPNKTLTSPMKRSKFRVLANRNKVLKMSLKYFKSRSQMFRDKCSALIEADCVRLTKADNTEIFRLAHECNDAAMQQFPEGSFQRIFWEQQLKFNSLPNKSSMRWHPVIIRWCLFLKNKSSVAYEGLKSYLNLPSERTLYDYSHYMENGVGVNARTVEQLIDQATKLGCFAVEHKSYVGLLHDEITIKSDLVFNKHTGQLIGYVNLDAIANELLELDRVATNESKLAKSVLVIMVRGITTNLCYPLASYSTSCLPSYCLYSIIWECVECIEVVVGLKTLFICCDGAVQNRKLFSLMSDGDDCSYMTRNPYVSDRDIYFICDPPHLLKTARNCFSNSFAHTQSRAMWFNQFISWKHVVQLFEDHCVKSEFKICPKLTKDHVYLTAFSRMKVNLAAQVLSNTVANALEQLYGESCTSTVTFIRMLNKWFDIVNVKNLNEGRHERNPNLAPFTDLNDPRLIWLERDFLQYLDEWKVAVDSRPGEYSGQQKNKMMLSAQTLAGFKITCQSIPEIVRIVLAAGAPFVLTNHINQDPLEQLFGHCRHKGGSNLNPNVAEACNSVNIIRTVRTQAVAKKRGNTSKCKEELDFSSVPKRRK